MNKKQTGKFISTAAIVLTSLLFPFSLFAQGMITNVTCSEPRPYFLEIGIGYSFSMKGDLEVDTSFWDQAVQGYDATLGNAPIFEAGIGYHINSWLDTAIAFAYRGNYKYEKFQIQPPSNTTPGPLGTKTRYFDLNNSSIMLNFVARGTDKYAYHFNNEMYITTFIGGGIGAARNEVFNFHSVTSQIDLNTNKNIVASIMNEKDNYSLAAQGMAGISWGITKRTILDFGYRFYYGGEFKTNDYTVDVPFGSEHAISAIPWEGNLTANEIFIILNFAIES